MYQVESAHEAMYQVEASKALLKPRLWARSGSACGSPRNVVMLGAVQPADRHLLGDGRDRSCRSTSSSRSAPARSRSARSTASTGRRGARPGAGSGFASDRWRRHKEVAGLGYGDLGRRASWRCCSPAGNRSAAIGAIVAVDRIGKGIRTAPRDALISLSSPRTARHLLRRAPGDGQRRRDARPAARLRHPARRAPARFDAVFVVSFCFAILGVGGHRAAGARRARRAGRSASRRAGHGAARCGAAARARLPQPHARRRRRWAWRR